MEADTVVSVALICFEILNWKVCVISCSRVLHWISVLVLGNAGILPNVDALSVGYFCVVLCHISPPAALQVGPLCSSRKELLRALSISQLLLLNETQKSQ